LVLACVAVASAPGSATAQTWQGSNGVWSNSANWLPAAPVSGTASALVFTGGTAQNDLGTTFDAGRITFSSGVTTLTGSAIRLATPSGTSIFNLTTAGTQTLGFGIDLGGASGTSTRIFTGTAGASGTSWTVFSGNISGTGGVLFTRTAGSAALPRFVLSGTNTYIGNTELGDAYLVLSGSASLASSGTLRSTANNNILDLSGFASGTLANNTFWNTVGGVGNVILPSGGNPLWLTGTMDVRAGGIAVSTSGTVYINSLTNTGTVSTGGFRVGNSSYAGTAVIYGGAQPSWNLKTTPLSVASGGSVIISHSNALGTSVSSTITLNSGNLSTTLPEWNVVQRVGLENASATISGTGNITLSNAVTSAAVVNNSNSRFTKSGPMTLTLGGTNVYANTTSVTEGVLLLSNSMSLPGGIEFNAVTVGGTSSHLRIEGTGVVGITTGTFSRTLGSGTSANDIGGNRVNLSSGGFAGYAANQVVNLGGASAVATWGVGGFGGVASGTFMGTATGTFILGSVGATHAIDFQNPINFSGTTRNIRADGPGGILSGVLSNGGLAKSGAGTLSLTADNLYTGTTTVVGGTLQVGNGGTTGSLAAGSPVSVSSTATLAFNRSNDLTYGGTVSGAGGLEKRGAGTLSLTGASGYTGATTIRGGTLQIGNGGTVGSIANTSPVSVVSGAALAFNRSNDLTYSGTVTGGGSLQKLGGGKLTLTSAQTFTGDTVVVGGTLALGNGATLASSFIKVGETAGSGAVLDIGALGAALSINAGKTLGGYGTVTGNTVVIANSGVISPGGSVGGITIGALEFGKDGVYTFEVNDATGSAGGPAGNGWDLVTVSSAFTLTADATDPFVIDLVSLNGTAPGSAANFVDSVSYQWKFLVANAPISNFNQSSFQVTYGSFVNPTNGSFYVAQGGVGGLGGSTTSNELYVVYSAVPEPGTLALAGIGIGIAGWAASRRTRRSLTG
jgi:autotransporter-associated beta strand protein